jgi:hypothetical protein
LWDDQNSDEKISLEIETEKINLEKMPPTCHLLIPTNNKSCLPDPEEKVLAQFHQNIPSVMGGSGKLFKLKF